MTKNFENSNLGKLMDIQTEEVQQISKRRNPKKSTLRHIIIKLPKSKTKEEFLKQQEKVIHRVQGDPIKL